MNLKFNSFLIGSAFNVWFLAILTKELFLSEKYCIIIVIVIKK